MKPFDLEVWYGERVAVLGSNGSGKSHFLRLLAAGGSDPDVEHRPVDESAVAPVKHSGVARLGARVRRAGSPRPTSTPSCSAGPCSRSCTAATPTATAWPRAGVARPRPLRAAHAAEQAFESLSGGSRRGFQILLLELSGATLLLLDEPTDNLDLVSAEALEEGLSRFDGTVVAVTHDRWFARGFDRFLVFGADGTVYESPEPVWDEARVARAR
jgi:ATPase subunit of ABC transporter with duplicated ATPase domains